MSNKSGLEIERRFILKCLSPIMKDNHVGSTNIAQLYLPDDGETVRRIREESAFDGSEITYTYTEKKEITPGVREEKEVEITEDEYYKYLEEATKYIVKARHRFKFPESGDLVWEIDVFLNVTMVIAEVELPSIDHNLAIPAFLADLIVMEVTQHPEFSNASLAMAYNPE